MKHSKNLNMTQGNPAALLALFALPMLVGNIFQQAYNLVDSVIVGKFVGADALAAVGSTGSVTFLFFSICNGIGSGSGIVTSQYFGAGVLYKKLSDYPRISRWELKTLAEFAAYEKAQGRGCTLHCGDEAMKTAILDAMAHPEVYRDTPRPALITECTACPVRKGCETAFVCHTTSPENARAILRCGRLLSAVLARGIPAEELARESRNAANDPADYFDYVMFTWGNCQGGDRLVTERRLGRFPDETDLSSGFEPGVRFYFRYDDLKKHPGVTFDGVLPMKVRDAVSLSENACAIVIPETLRREMDECIPAELCDRVIYVKNDCADIWEWSEKVYSIIETKYAGE